MEARRFVFFQFLDPADPIGSKYQMDGQVLQARQLIVLFEEENRKKATEMRTREFRATGTECVKSNTDEPQMNKIFNFFAPRCIFWSQKDFKESLLARRS